MLGKEEKAVLKLILKNKLMIDHKHITIEKLSKTTDYSEEKLYEIISRLLILQHIRMIKTMNDWTVNPFNFTEKGMLALQINRREIIKDIFIGIATMVSIIALFVGTI